MIGGTNEVAGSAPREPRPGPRPPWSWLLLAGLLAASLRLLPLVAGADLPPVSDGAHFDRIARSLLAGTGFGEIPGFRTAHRAPLQPLWLAGLYALLGPGTPAGLGGGALLGGIGAIATGLLAFRLAGRRAALLASLAAAGYPRLIDYATRLWSLSEGLGVVVLVAALVAWERAEAGRRPGMAWLAGVGFGLAALARPVMLLLPAGLALRRGHAGRRQVLLAWLGFALAVAPWSWRNYQVFGRFIPISTMGGIVFYQGFHPPAEGWGFTPWEEIHRVAGNLPSEAAVSDALVRATLADIAAQPLAMARLLPWKVVELLNPFSERDGRLDLAFLAVLALGLLGLATRWREAAAGPLVLVLLYLLGMTLVFYGSPRFRLPMEPLLIALGAAWVAPRLDRRAGRLALAALLAVVVLGGRSDVVAIDRRAARQRLERWLGGRPGSPAQEAPRPGTPGGGSGGPSE